MGSIPLAALNVRPPEQNASALDQYARIMQIKQQQALMPGQLQQQQQTLEAGNLENQQRQQQLKDQQAVTAAMKEWDGKDFSALPSLVLKNGGSGQTVISMKNGLIKQQQDLANLSKDQLANMSAVNDQLLGHIDTLKGVTDPVARAQAAKAQGTQILNSPLAQMLDPQTQQMVQGMAQGQFIPNDDQLSVFEKGLTAHSKQIEQAAKEAETGKNTAQAARDTAEATKTNMETDYMKQFGGMTQAMADSRYRSVIGKQRLGQPVSPEDQAFVAAYEKQKTLAPIAQINVQNALNKGGQSALSNVPAHLVGPATSAAEKANSEYADAKSVSDRMSATMDAARKGNVISYQIIPEEGTLQITTSQGVHRINKTEIDQYAGGGSLWQRLQGDFGKALTGKSIPDSVLNDMAEIQKIQAQGAESRYRNKLKSINHTYGSSFEPVTMEGLTPNAPAQNPPSPQQKPSGSFDWNAHPIVK